MIKIIKEPKYDGYELKCKRCKTKFKIKFVSREYCWCPKCEGYVSINFWSKKIYQGDWDK